MTHNLKFQKYCKKIQKIKNDSMASFKARIGWKRPRKKESKYCRSVSFLPSVIENSKKNSKKIQKN